MGSTANILARWDDQLFILNSGELALGTAKFRYWKLEH
ncbi:hypothetical protein KUC_2744 [Vreelandella boliviensis LC1]|uniref:Uncharacterized protein n=1 Tax=Vreelandella boliviensis LC1 TaxID=1072583 RepID=A0A7U9C400_9GAMM|nr:hypothetical protein KUC_2744 [Halomonas boliviensis LC1]